MKKSVVKLFCLAALPLSVATTSCSSDDNNNSNPNVEIPCNQEIDRENLQGEFNCDIVLESGTYKLTGALVIKDGGSLRIKPGVKIIATELAAEQFAEVRYIAIAQGAKIFVEGTSTNPVVMTSEVEQGGSWGGLVICGKAEINTLAGVANAEVSGLTYGGEDNEDNSGSIRYLRIEYSGYNYNADKEFNGLSMFGVGKGTTIEYVQIYEGSDDGFEWFGGNVGGKYLMVTNNQSVPDDLFDWTEGWTGDVQFLYGARSINGNRGIEADNHGTNSALTPVSFPTIKNLSLVGRGSEADTTTESQALKIRFGSKGHFENVVLKGFKTGIDIQHDESVNFIGTDLKINNVKFIDIPTIAVAKNTAGNIVDANNSYTEDNTAVGAGNADAIPTWAQGWTK